MIINTFAMTESPWELLVREFYWEDVVHEDLIHIFVKLNFSFRNKFSNPLMKLLCNRRRFYLNNSPLRLENDEIWSIGFIEDDGQTFNTQKFIETTNWFDIEEGCDIFKIRSKNTSITDFEMSMTQKTKIIFDWLE